MERPPAAAAISIGARSLAAVEYQNAPSLRPVREGVASTNQAAIRCAPVHVDASRRGDHLDVRADAPDLADPVGSNTQVRPRRARGSRVKPTRSAFTDVATTGPSHSKRAGMARPVVLPDCVGPRTSTEWRASVARRPRPRRPGRPSTSRPPPGLRTLSWAR